MKQALIAAALAALGFTAVAHEGGEPTDPLGKSITEVRRATAAYKDVQRAAADGYAQFLDCTAQDGVGAMGVHYLNGTLISDAVLDPLKPEFLVYQDGKDGKRQLVALEYVVFAPMWDAVNPQPPTLFGHPLHLVRTPNRYGTTDPFYELHVWLWEHNANGLFNDWNPSFECH